MSNCCKLVPDIDWLKYCNKDDILNILKLLR